MSKTKSPTLRKRYPLLATEALIKTLSPLSNRYHLTSGELYLAGIDSDERPEELTAVIGYWKDRPQERASLRTVLATAYLVTFALGEEHKEDGVLCRVTSLKRVKIKRTSQKEGGRVSASVALSPIIEDEQAQERHDELKRVIQEELKRHGLKVPKLESLLKRKRRTPLIKWSEELFALCKPDVSLFKLWLETDLLANRYATLSRACSMHLMELTFFDELKMNMKEQFLMGRQRQELMRRLKGMKMMLDELTEHEQRMKRKRALQRAALFQAEGEEEDEGEEPQTLGAQWGKRAGEQVKEGWGPFSDDDDEDEGGSLEERLASLELTPEASREVKRALKSLRSGPSMGAEAHTTRSFLEVVAELPWEHRSERKVLDLQAVERALDEEHEGLGEVKERILEHLAVSSLSGATQGSVLCLSGPPGVGKTSLVKQIASALGRPFVRISLGGVEDEAAIRGHRKTYVGAMPGRICDALRQAKVKDPVILLDEVDKVGESRRGSPEAALLEVLDPEQNATFRDHYLEIPLDLSEVLFICTVNDPRQLSAPLRDRLEMVELSGYLDHEKRDILQRHLLPRSLASHGLAPDALSLSDEVSDVMISRYTREAGVRQLERVVRHLCRKLARETVTTLKRNEAPSWRPEVGELTELIGAPKYRKETPLSFKDPGLACGLAWSAVGGSVLHIETARYPGKGALKLTGRLGEVMQESAQTALTALRVKRGEELIEAHSFTEQDLHVHFPEGATPKDGPSAGVTLYCALYSLMSGRALREDVAMTGECTLQGRVLAVGGLKEKLLAAQRGGMRRVILPEENRDEVMGFEPVTRGELELVWVTRADEALEAALS